MKKYYAIFLVPLLGIIPINKGIFNNYQLDDQKATITDISAKSKDTGAVFDTDFDGYGDQLYMWGEFGDYNWRTPTLVDFNWNGNLIDFELSYGTAGVTVDTDYDGYADTLYMWGSNFYAQIGNGNMGGWIETPTIITPEGKDNWNGNIIDLSLEEHGSSVTIDTDYDGYADTLYMWGDKYHGQISDTTLEDFILYPTEVTPINQTNWNGNIMQSELTDSFYSISVDTDYDGYADTLYSWGKYLDRDMIIYPQVITPENGDWNGNIINFAISDYNESVIIDTNNDNIGDTFYVWGSNSYGQLGNGTFDEETLIYPQRLEFNFEGNLIKSAIGYGHIGIIIDTDFDGYGDSLYVWGENQFGQVGNGEFGQFVFVTEPTLITPEGQENWNGNILDLSLGKTDTMILVDQNKDGLGDTIWMWGSNSLNELGIFTISGVADKPIQTLTTII